MKAGYFPSCDFLQAKIGANPSYMWRSILAAEELVCQESRKRIGNGEARAVWGIPWLPCEDNGYLTTEMPHQLEDTRVVNFLNTGTYCWDDEVENDVCNGRDAQLIRSIPNPLQEQEDSWYWILEATGLFSVKSCYRRIHGEQHWDPASFWRKVWSLELPGKVINFVWRVCRYVLPTAVALATKRVQIDQKCLWRLVCNEDAHHIFHQCF